MPASHDFSLRTTPDVAASVVRDVLRGAGWSVDALPGFGLRATRGSLPVTVVLGGLAGPGFHLTFDVELFETADGSAVARLHRAFGSPVVRGGSRGASLNDRAFTRLADTLRTELGRSELLTGSVANYRAPDPDPDPTAV